MALCESPLRITLKTCVLALLLLSVSTAAQAWWDDGWEYRKKVVLNTSSTGADIKANLSEVTVLLRLHSANFNFTNAKPGGQDIRFVGSGDTQVLEHHVELYDAAEEIGFIWVKVPVLSGNSKQHVWMYYGNDEAGAIKDTGKTFDANHVGVYHFEEDQGAPQDNTVYGNHVSDFSLGQGFPSVIGNGVRFSGGGDRLVIPFSPSMDFKSGLTFSAWLKISGPVESGALFSTSGQEQLFVGLDGTTVFARAGTASGETVATERSSQIPPDSWHHLAVTFDPGNRITLYLDGVQATAAQMDGELPQLSGDLVIGSSPMGAYVGEMDEVHLSKMPRPAEWIRAAYFSQGPEQGFLSLGTEEMAEGGGGIPVFYLGTIFENITLEGWVIIVILLFLALFSWLVLLTKAFFLKMTERDNKEFIDTFKELGDEEIMSLYSEESEFDNSSLYTIYSEGCHELLRWLNRLEDNGYDRQLIAKTLNSLKSALERTYVTESKKLNAWLVVMTVAISGGPFLGLLGTVWGVMNTFAAMALAGEANLMAIAPGVASALSTTVFGLVVAIPALFGYNYLTTKIKNITMEMNIFVDAFALKVEEML